MGTFAKSIFDGSCAEKIKLKFPTLKNIIRFNNYKHAYSSAS